MLAQTFPTSASERLGLDPRQAQIRIPEVLEVHSHSVHDRQIETAQLPVLVALVHTVQHTTCFDCPAQSAGQQHGHFVGIMFTVGPHVGDPHQTGVRRERESRK